MQDLQLTILEKRSHVLLCFSCKLQLFTRKNAKRDTRFGRDVYVADIKEGIMKMVGKGK